TEQDAALKVPLAETLFTAAEVNAAREEWQRRLAACPVEERTWLITQYATPVRNQYQLRAETAA
ncbi:MAG: glycerol acyltransferase, partial [Pseudomonas sp.]